MQNYCLTTTVIYSQNASDVLFEPSPVWACEWVVVHVRMLTLNQIVATKVEFGL